MARPVIDIRLIGDKALIRNLAKTADASQRRIVRGAMKRGAQRVQGRIVQSVSGQPIGIDTGALLTAFAGVRLIPLGRVSQTRTRTIGTGIPLPTREDLSIDARDKWYYPVALEYGTKERVHRRFLRKPRRLGAIKETRFIRNAVDDYRQQELATIGRDIGKGIEREWRKLAK